MGETKRTVSKKAADKAKAERSAEAVRRDKKQRKLWSLLLFSVGVLIIVFSVLGNVNSEEKNAADHINRFLRGLFGFSVFFIGPILIYISVMISMNKRGGNIAAKLLQLFFIILLISAGIQIIFVGALDVAEGEKTASVLFENGVNLKGGGLSGAVLGIPLLFFGRVTAGIIVVLIGFVMFMLSADMTLHEFLKFISAPFRLIGKAVKTKAQEYREDSEHLRMYHEESAKLEKVAKGEVVTSEEEKALKKKLKFAEIEAAVNAGREHDKPMQVSETADTASTAIADPPPPPEPPPPHDLHNPNEDFQKQLSEYASGDESPHDESHEPPSNPVLDAIKKYNAENLEEAETNQKNVQSLNFTKTELFRSEDRSEIEKAAENFPAPVSAPLAAKEPQYLLPPVTLLNEVAAAQSKGDIDAELAQNSETLVETLKSFGVLTKIVGVCRGPSVTRYELQPAPGVKISKITGLIDDIALNLATAGVRIEAPIPNKAAVGIEVPNRTTDTVSFRSMVDSMAFKGGESKLAAVIGTDISGEIIVCDVAKMPHILIAGTTGSGKSVCVNSIIMSILFRATPDDVRFVMIDPKAVEFMIYNGIPHLLIPVVTDPKKAAGALGWAVTEMMNRYKSFSDYGVRDLSGYNSLCAGDPELVKMPQIVIFIDEFADLMMVAPGDVENGVCRLAQMGRASGIHLVIATQRPSVDVITGIIKANISSRIALKVASQVDSRTIIDSAGADKLLGKGDMLFFPVGAPKPLRVQGCWVSEKEVERTADFIKKSFILDYDESVIKEIEENAELVGLKKSEQNKAAQNQNNDLDINDDKLDEAIEAVIEAGQASTSYLQRKLKLGYGRAARLIDIMEQMGVVGTFEGSKPRQVIMTKHEWHEMRINKDT
ncbi:MAG: DNA translocase FtsK [Oscillospiraceae bacterium]|nr:DNA translocase FtsK [Oscillospiraceae bacterium]